MHRSLRCSHTPSMLRSQRLASLEIHLFMSFFALLKSKFSIRKESLSQKTGSLFLFVVIRLVAQNREGSV